MILFRNNLYRCFFVTLYSSYEQYPGSPVLSVQKHSCDGTIFVFRRRTGPAPFRFVIYCDPTPNDKMKIPTDNTGTTSATRFDLAMELSDPDSVVLRASLEVGAKTHCS